MSSPSRNRIAWALLASGLLAAAGCVDYTNRFDSVNIHAGDAPYSNVAIQTIDPWPPASERTYVDHVGRKTIHAVDAYTAPRPPPSAGTTNITINN
jgi:hypothetical protein